MNEQLERMPLAEIVRLLAPHALTEEPAPENWTER